MEWEGQMSQFKQAENDLGLATLIKGALSKEPCGAWIQQDPISIQQTSSLHQSPSLTVP